MAVHDGLVYMYCNKLSMLSTSNNTKVVLHAYTPGECIIQLLCTHNNSQSAVVIKTLKGLCAVYETIQVQHENVILYLNKKSREVLSLHELVNTATRKTQVVISYAIRSCDH